jgi:4'-phosphopantetheinyl transferase
MYLEDKYHQRALRNGHMVLACMVACDNQSPAAIDQLAALLSMEELDQAGRFRFIQDQVSFLYAHALTRIMLSILLPRPPRAWAFEADAFGRPGLCRGQTDYALWFSRSHTVGFAACALGIGSEVGIDVENRSTGRLLAMHDDWLTAGERAALNVFAPEAKGDAAVRFWTLKEAFSKAAGMGLYQPFGEVGFKLDPPRFARLPRAYTGYWQLAQMCPGPSHVLAVAVRCARQRPVRIKVEVLPAGTLGELAK